MTLRKHIHLLQKTQIKLSIENKFKNKFILPKKGPIKLDLKNPSKWRRNESKKIKYEGKRKDALIQVILSPCFQVIHYSFVYFLIKVFNITVNVSFRCHVSPVWRFIFTYSNGVSIKALHVPAIIPPQMTLVSSPFIPGNGVFPNLLSKIV